MREDERKNDEWNNKERKFGKPIKEHCVEEPISGRSIESNGKD